MSKKVGVVLSGCGVFDGSEIYEATLTLYFLGRAGAETLCTAPEREQRDVIDHSTGQVVSESRKVFVEAARLARGEIRRITDVSAGDLDAVIFPGGFGAAKNLCDFAVAGANCTVIPEVEKIVLEMHGQKKPQGFMCIAPVIAARVLGSFSPELTVGDESDVSKAVEEMGARHVKCGVDAVAVDERNRVVTTPAYMIGPGIADVAKGIEKLVNEVLKRA